MIIDCFTFCDELDLLEVRLHELKDVVDVFVLSEALFTFTGNPKPLYYYENKERFNGFNIVHAVCDSPPAASPSEMERRQNQHAIDYVFDNLWTRGDMIIQTDCDEIPRADTIRKSMSEDFQSARMSMRLFYYYMNCAEISSRKWRNGRIIRPEKRFKYNVKQNDRNDVVYDNAGWHFSFLGGAWSIQKKIAAWGHANEYNRAPYNTIEHIQRCMDQGTDIFMRKGKRAISFEFIDLDLPKYIIENMKKLKGHLRAVSK